MKRFGCITATVALVTWLSGAALAQAPLGLSISPTHGIRGSTVNAQVNVEDIAANCNTTVESLQAVFEPVAELLNNDYDFISLYFPACVDPSDPECSVFLTNYTYEQEAYTILGLGSVGISFNADLGFGPAAELALPQTFVLTFLTDILTQQLVGERSLFDMTTGMGSVTVPDITPGTYPVAAACVEPNSVDLAGALMAAISAGAAYLQSLGTPTSFATDSDFVLGLLDPTSDWFILDVLPNILPPLMVPKAVGLQLFTIDTPTLGFTIDPTQGFPGDTVNGQVDPDDVAAHCVTDLTEFQAQFEALFEGPYAFGGPEGEFFDTFFPGGDFVFENNEQSAYSLTGLAVLGIAADIGGAVATAFPQTFVMTFADLLTQEPLGPLGHFDPFTGVGSVVVPDLAPGPYPVAATCVRPSLDLNLLIAGIQANGAFLDSIGAPPDINSPEFDQFVKDYLGDPNADPFTFIFAIGPTLIQNIVEIRALGVQFYTVLAHLNHFQCYRARTTGFNQLPVTLADRFGTRSVTVRKPVDLCAPADKNGEDPEAPDSPFFLTSYKVSGARSSGQIAVHAENQFGPVDLKIKGPKTILVPTGVSQSGPPSSPDGAFLNHFTCYKARAAAPPNAPTPGVVTVQTAFETVQIQPKKPRSLCVPAHKNGGPIVPTGPENLLCYKAKSSGGLPSPAPVVFLANQFGDQTQRLGKRSDICIPTDLLE
jgi:hypothetical protein